MRISKGRTIRKIPVFNFIKLDICSFIIGECVLIVRTKASYRLLAPCGIDEVAKRSCVSTDARYVFDEDVYFLRWSNVLAKLWLLLMSYDGNTTGNKFGLGIRR